MVEDRSQAVRLIDDLRRGTLSGHPVAARKLQVGRDFWMRGVQEELRNARDHGTSPVRVVIGSYGDGKSHFLQAVLGEALSEGFWCSYCSLERDAALKKLELEVLWKHVVRKLYVPGVAEPVDLAGALERVAGEKGFDQLRQAVVNAQPETDFERGVIGYLERVELRQDTREWRYWLAGERAKPPGVSRRIDANNVLLMLESLVRFVRQLGYAGIAIALDEMELAKDQTTATRRRFYESVRQLIDRQMAGYVVYGASTPDMLADERGFSEHQPLWSRLRVYVEQSGGREPSPAQPVIFLEAIPLGAQELVEIGRRVRRLHAVAGNWDAETAYSDEVVEAVAREVAGMRGEVGRPRVFVTMIVRDLDRKRAEPQFEPLRGIVARTLEVAEQAGEEERRRHR